MQQRRQRPRTRFSRWRETLRHLFIICRYFTLALSNNQILSSTEAAYTGSILNKSSAAWRLTWRRSLSEFPPSALHHMVKMFSRLALLLCVVPVGAFNIGKFVDAKLGAVSGAQKAMQRPSMDKAVVQFIDKAERARITSALVTNEAWPPGTPERPKSKGFHWDETPGNSADGTQSEPLEWAESDSLAQKVSSISQKGPLATFKQFVADRLAGDFDEAATQKLIDQYISKNKVMMFSFTTCPFCLKAKAVLDAKGVTYKVVELDVDEQGSAIRALLGRSTGRTSMPSVWVGGQFVGGANDGGLGGVVTLDKSNELEPLLKKAGAMPLFNPLAMWNQKKSQ
eukprot:scaffold2506_cov236-Pinguiococcus_pyrenoidosus.AAC.2